MYRVLLCRRSYQVLLHYRQREHRLAVTLTVSLSRCLSSSLGTPDPPKHLKAGERKKPERENAQTSQSTAGWGGDTQMQRQTHASPPSVSHQQTPAVLGTTGAAAPAASSSSVPTPPPPASLLSSPFPVNVSASSTDTSTSSTTTAAATATAPASLATPANTSKQGSSSFILPPLSPSSPLLRGVLWFDCVYPVQAHWLDPRHLFAHHNHETLIPQIMPDDVDIVSMIPRMKEGGVFVHFECRKSVDNYSSPVDVANAVIRRLRAHPVRARFTTRPVHAHLVKGDPFIEDLLSRFPSNRLKIEMKGSNTALSEVTLEHLFGELRAFGRINDVVLLPSIKDQPRQASVQYRKMQGGIGARNCLHRYSISVTIPSYAITPNPTATAALTAAVAPVTLFLTYDSILKTSYVIDFGKNHPRIMVPLLGLLFAAFTFLIFDPLRSFNITNKITGRFTLQSVSHRGPLPYLHTKLAALFKHRIFDVFKHGSADTVVKSSWSARENDEERVNRWLASIPDKLLFLTGPKGAGKLALVKKVTQDRPNVLMIDVGSLIDRSDDEFVKGFSSAIGFAPGFSLLSWTSSLMDIFTPGAGKATGIGSSQFSSQLQKILEVTTDALVNIDGKQVKKMKASSDGEVTVMEGTASKGEITAAKEIIVDPKQLTESSLPKLPDKNIPAIKDKQTDTNKQGHGQTQRQQDKPESTPSPPSISLESTALKAQTAALSHASSSSSSASPVQLYSDQIPLFIIDGFTPDNKDKHQSFMNTFVLFASQMTSAQLARFLFLTDSTLCEGISKEMPDVKLTEVSLSDADTQSALQFVMNSIGVGTREKMTEETRKETEAAVGILGGRYSDLLSLVRQLESGSSPLDAAEEIVNQSKSIVRNMLFSDGGDNQNKEHKWNKVQLWLTVNMLVNASVDSVGYDNLLFNVFNGDDAALRSLVRADVLRIESRINDQDRVKAGSPVLLEAFKRLLHSESFRPGVDVLVAKAIISNEQKKIIELEDELNKLNRAEIDYANKEQIKHQYVPATKKHWWSSLSSWLYKSEDVDEKERKLFLSTVTDRRLYLLQNIQDIQDKIDKFEQQRRTGEKIIKQATHNNTHNRANK